MLNDIRQRDEAQKAGERESDSVARGQERRVMVPGSPQLQERNRSIGQQLRTARKAKRLSTDAVARFIGTTRRRYTSMENGEALIGAAELEELRRYLDIPARLLWGEEVEEFSERDQAAAAVINTIPIQVQPGQRVQIVVSGV